MFFIVIAAAGVADVPVVLFNIQGNQLIRGCDVHLTYLKPIFGL